MRYYSRGCVNWRWSYRWSKKSILLKDIMRGMSLLKNECDLRLEELDVEKSKEYVLKQEGVEVEVEAEWDYKRYMWECDLIFPASSNIPPP